MKYQGREVIK